MKCKDRNGEIISANECQDSFLEKLYTTKLGRGCLKILIRPSISKMGGWVLERGVSKLAIKSFINNNHIQMDEYEDQKYRSYNAFFTRKIKAGKRPLDTNSNHFIAPCDSKLSVFPITSDARFTVKNTQYSMESLTRSKKIAEEYRNGYLLLFRLTVDDYHRYCYVDNGKKSRNFHIKGVFHTVNPLANDQYPIYKENTREFSFLKSEHFGTVMMMEVGALMVGRIVNYHEEKTVTRGEEKGRFEFGGSTIILCVKEGAINIDEDILTNSKEGIETKVKYGEKIAIKI
ncbi:phosphatidylserine decarboxylase [Clostridiales Family XIII bacterium PM5-7]